MTTIAVVGSLTRDRIIIKSKNADFYQAGGGVYYSSHALASLGVQVLAIPLLSKNDRALLTSLQHKGIEILPQWTPATTYYQNTYPAASLDICEKKILSWVKGYAPSASLLKRISRCNAIHLVPLSSQEFQSDFFQRLRKGFCGTISIDGQGFTQGPRLDFKPLLQNNVDIIKVDDSEACYLAGQEDELEAMEELASWGIKEILITKASRGSSIFFDGKVHRISPHRPEKEIDATGCGDAYIGGYLKKRLAGCKAVQAADFASLMGAKNLEYQGALAGDFSKLE